MSDRDVDVSEDLVLLGVVYHCYHENGVKGAARKMKRSQSWIREKLAKFEANSGFPLFQRQPWKRLPIAEFVVKVLAEPPIQNLTDYYRNRHLLLRPQIRLGGPDYALGKFIIPLLRMLRAAHPDLVVSLESGRRAQLRTLLDADRIDLMLVLMESPPVGLGWQQILPLPMMFLVRADSPFTTMEQILRAPSRPPLVCPVLGEAVANRFYAFLRQHGASWNVSMEVGASVFVPPTVIAGMGIGPCVGLSTLLDHPELRAIPLPGVEDVYLGAAWKKEPEAATRQFLELLAREAPQVAAALLTAVLSAHAVAKTSSPAAGPAKAGLGIGAKTKPVSREDAKDERRLRRLRNSG